MCGYSAGSRGVWYRGWTVETARALGLTGWVRNRADGSVEAHVEGKQADIERLLHLAWSGPSAARVEDVRDEPTEIGAFESFEQRATL